MKTIEKILPAGFRFRELWLPEVQNNSATIPSAVAGGHKLTHTGARNGTTTDGVRFTGAATSNAVIAAAAANNNKAAFHITVRFKLSTTFAAGAAGNFYLMNKVNAATYIRVYLKAADGKLYWEQDDGAGGAGFSLTSTTVSWVAGTWYTVTCSMTDAPAQRLLVNGTAEDTDTSGAVATPAGGDVVLASSSDGGTDGVVGTISLICIGTGATAAVALTAAEEADLYNGTYPATAKVQYFYVFDEGEGFTLVDRSATAANATLDSACTWAFGTCKQAALNVFGPGVITNTTASVRIDGAVTLFWAGKLRSTFGSTVTSNHILTYPYIDANNRLAFMHINTVNGFKFDYAVGGVTKTLTYSDVHAIGDYVVLVGTRDASGNLAFYKNGALVDSDTGAAAMPSTLATLYIQEQSTALVTTGLIEGAMSAAQAKQFSRTLDQMFNLGIGV